MRIILPPIKWDTANDGLDSRHVSNWLQNYELQQLPSDTLFPRPGEIWEAVADCVVNFAALIRWQGKRPSSKHRLPTGEELLSALPFEKTWPVFPFGKFQLTKGELLRVCDADEATGSAWPRPLAVSLRPLRYQELEALIVPQTLRDIAGYTGYLLNVRTAKPRLCLDEGQAFLNEDFRLVEAVA